mgnify:CR=1 FL=1
MRLSPVNSMSSSLNESRHNQMSPKHAIDNCQREANIMRKEWAPKSGFEIISLSAVPQTADQGPGWSLHYLQVSEITMKSQMIVFWQKWADCRLKSSSTLILRNILPIEFPLENISCARDVWRRRRGIRSSGGGMVKVIRSQESPYLLLTVSLAPWQSFPPATHHSTQPHSAPSSLKLKIFS